MPGSAWKNGSSAGWRKTRAAVLARDGYRCQVKTARCTHVADTVHHTVARQLAGDNPDLLVASCTPCNQAEGDPRKHDPAPRPRTRWDRRS